MAEIEGIKRMVDRQLEHGKKEEELKKQEVEGLFTERARVHLTVQGKVQGVFFRDFTKKTADSLGVAGWVRNTDNAVEIVAEGEKRKLRELIIQCKKGPPLAKVENVEQEWGNYTGKFTGFFIKY